MGDLAIITKTTVPLAAPTTSAARRNKSITVHQKGLAAMRGPSAFYAARELAASRSTDDEWQIAATLTPALGVRC